MITSLIVGTTITLIGPASGFGVLRQFYNVPNDAVVTPLNIVQSTLSASTYLTLGDVVCSANSGQTLTCSDGSWAIVDLQESYRRVCVRVGRGQSCHLLWTLESGTIERP